MTTKNNFVPVAGSERLPLPGANSIGPIDPNEQIEVTVRVRRRSHLAANDIEQMATRLPHQRQHLSHEEYEQTYGAAPKDLEKIENFAREFGLNVVNSSVARRSVVLSGTVADLSKAFAVQLETYQHAEATYRGRTGTVNVPESIKEIVQGVYGLDNRPVAKPYFRHFNSQASSTSYTPLQLAQIYNFPQERNGEGQCIAIIELGGGYKPDDLTTYFSELGIPTPTVSSISVDGGKNQPGDPKGADGEVMLDIEVAGAITPKAKIAVYFAPNTDRGFLDTITTAIHDTENKPSVISISWVASESNWTSQALQDFNQAFQTAAALGITVCAASGDTGSSDRITDHKAHVNFPSSSPYVLSCGGTRLTASGTTIAEEVVWNDNDGSEATGGGVSDVFDLPSWQSAAGIPPSINPGGRIGRGVPDVAGDADPATGYQVRVDGKDMVIGGTSAVAPLWAGLIALINQELGKSVGYLNPLLYRSQCDKILHDIVKGNNGRYSAQPGWDACTGLGSPDGTLLLEALKSGSNK